MENEIKCIIIANGTILISKIEEVGSELGEPDCKLTNPFVIKNSQVNGMDSTLEPWMQDYTKEKEFMIHSDKILTIIEPKPTLMEKYIELIP